MPYLLPNTFDASGRDHASVIASSTEALFAPDVELKVERAEFDAARIVRFKSTDNDGDGDGTISDGERCRGRQQRLQPLNHT